MLIDDLEVYVTHDDGARFIEHQIIEDKGTLPGSRILSCHLEIEEGNTFVIHFCRMSGYTEWALDVFVDRRKVDSRILTTHGAVGQTSTMRYLEGGKMMEGSLTFSRLLTTDNEAEVSLVAEKLDSVGEIKVTLWRGRSAGPSPPEPPPLVPPTLGIAHERTKKWVLSSSWTPTQLKPTRLAATVSSTQAKETNRVIQPTRFEHQDRKPYHTFTFFYRTKAVLERLKIIKPPTSGASQEAGSSPQFNSEAEVIEVSSDEDESDLHGMAGRSKGLMKRRIQYLEEETRILRQRVAMQGAENEEIHVDLTGEEDD